MKRIFGRILAAVLLFGAALAVLLTVGRAPRTMTLEAGHLALTLPAGLGGCETTYRCRDSLDWQKKDFPVLEFWPEEDPSARFTIGLLSPRLFWNGMACWRGPDWSQQLPLEAGMLDCCVYYTPDEDHADFYALLYDVSDYSPSTPYPYWCFTRSGITRAQMERWRPEVLDILQNAQFAVGLGKAREIRAEGTAEMRQRAPLNPGIGLCFSVERQRWELGSYMPGERSYHLALLFAPDGRRLGQYQVEIRRGGTLLYATVPNDWVYEPDPDAEAASGWVWPEEDPTARLWLGYVEWGTALDSEQSTSQYGYARTTAQDGGTLRVLLANNLELYGAKADWTEEQWARYGDAALEIADSVRLPYAQTEEELLACAHDRLPQEWESYSISFDPKNGHWLVSVTFADPKRRPRTISLDPGWVRDFSETQSAAP